MGGKRLSKEDKAKRVEAILEARMQKKQAREAKRKEREKIAEERAKKREERKAHLKVKRDLERNIQTKRRKKVANSVQWDENSRKTRELPPYSGTLSIGDTVACRFAGYIFKGTLVSVDIEKVFGGVSEIVDEEGNLVENQEQDDKGRMVKYYCVKSSDGTIYPVLRKDIVAKKINK